MTLRIKRKVGKKMDNDRKLKIENYLGFTVEWKWEGKEKNSERQLFSLAQCVAQTS